MDKRRKTWLRILVAFIPTIVGFVLFALSPFGIRAGFPPSLWLAHQLNRRTFAGHERAYRGMATEIRHESLGLKEGERAYFELGPGMEAPTLRRLPGDTASERMDELFDDARLVEVQVFRGGGVAMRFITRHVWDGGTYSLVHWDPKPAEDCVWWATDLVGQPAHRLDRRPMVERV